MITNIEYTKNFLDNLTKKDKKHWGRKPFLKKLFLSTVNQAALAKQFPEGTNCLQILEVTRVPNENAYKVKVYPAFKQSQEKTSTLSYKSAMPIELTVVIGQNFQELENTLTSADENNTVSDAQDYQMPKKFHDLLTCVQITFHNNITLLSPTLAYKQQKLQAEQKLQQEQKLRAEQKLQEDKKIYEAKLKLLQFMEDKSGVLTVDKCIKFFEKNPEKIIQAESFLITYLDFLTKNSRDGSSAERVAQLFAIHHPKEEGRAFGFFQWAKICLKFGRAQDAEFFFKKYLELVPLHKDYLEVAELALQAGNFQSALSNIQKLLKIYMCPKPPTSSLAHYSEVKLHYQTTKINLECENQALSMLQKIFSALERIADADLVKKLIKNPPPQIYQPTTNPWAEITFYSVPPDEPSLPTLAP